MFELLKWRKFAGDSRSVHENLFNYIVNKFLIQSNG